MMEWGRRLVHATLKMHVMKKIIHVKQLSDHIMHLHEPSPAATGALLSRSNLCSKDVWAQQNVQSVKTKGFKDLVLEKTGRSTVNLHIELTAFIILYVMTLFMCSTVQKSYERLFTFSHFGVDNYSDLKQYSLKSLCKIQMYLQEAYRR